MQAIMSTRGGGRSKWCPVCGTAHDDPRDCPGELRATGSERPGWRVHVETPFGHEAIGVLLAPSHDVWRARIVTYPNVLWTLPGGRGTMKFVGETPEEAERSAVAYIEDHVRAKRFLRRDALDPVAASPAVKNAPGEFLPRALKAISQRKTRALPVRFGPERAATRGVTFNLSTEGMFVGAPDPLDGGRVLFIHLDVSGHTLPLRGLVMWRRERGEAGRPVGMGIRLTDPPPFYRSFVAALP
jgi:hypothetical protein